MDPTINTNPMEIGKTSGFNSEVSSIENYNEEAKVAPINDINNPLSPTASNQQSETDRNEDVRLILKRMSDKQDIQLDNLVNNFENFAEDVHSKIDNIAKRLSNVERNNRLSNTSNKLNRDTTSEVDNNRKEDLEDPVIFEKSNKYSLRKNYTTG